MFDPPSHSSSTTTSVPNCRECGGTHVTKLYHLKLLKGPMLHDIAVVAELCPYCTDYD